MFFIKYNFADWRINDNLVKFVLPLVKHFIICYDMELEQAALYLMKGSRAGIAVGNTPQDLKFGGVFFYYEK
jgi:hypothetical protein